MKTNTEIRALSASQMQGNWKAAVIITLIYVVIEAVAMAFGQMGNFAAYVSYVLMYLFVLFPLAFGFYLTFLALARDGKPLDIKDFFEGFNTKFYTKAIVVQLLVAIFVFLWSLLLIVPGVIKACSYILAPFIVAENPDISAMDAIKRSEQMMEGHKMSIFLISLGLLGCIILSLLLLGIPMLWIVPYYMSVYSNFYLEVKNEYKG